MTRNTLTVIDNRTGASFELPVDGGAVSAGELTAAFGSPNGHGLTIYDPGFTHTAAWRSSITTIDMQHGVLRHRGYAIEDLCRHATYLEVAYLLIYGELPSPAEFDRFQNEFSSRKFVHENVQSFIAGFRYDAHPMAILAATVGALASFYPDAGDVHDEGARERQVMRLLAKMPTLTAFAYRHMKGQPYVYPVDDLSYAGNLLSMLFRMTELRYTPDPVLERTLDVLLMLHADHEQNASTTAVRAVGSTHVDPYAAIAAGVAALSGPMRGGAARDSLTMLRQIGAPGGAADFLERVKSGHERLPGFGHWVYKTHDPRARILRNQLEELYEARGRNPLVDVADELAARAAEDDYFVSRGVYPNLDLYAGLAYDAIGIPTEMFGTMFALARSAGWLAQWLEMLEAPEQTTVRPRQLYDGEPERPYVPPAQRA